MKRNALDKVLARYLIQQFLDCSITWIKLGREVGEISRDLLTEFFTLAQTV